MRNATYVSFEHGGRRGVGEVVGNATVVPLSGATIDAGIDAIYGAPRDWAAAVPLDAVRLLPAVPDPGKIIGVATNYLDALQAGQPAPRYPALFTKFADSIVGADDPIVLPPESADVDYEGELAVVIGRAGRRITEARAGDHILGYTLANDVTVRDYQSKAHQWLQGKAWDASTPLGPWIVTPSALDADAEITTEINGATVQRSDLSRLIFGVSRLISLISTFTTLRPGDVILTGTPAGTGHTRQPRRYLRPGDEITVSVAGLGSLRNTVVAENVDLTA